MGLLAAARMMTDNPRENRRRAGGRISVLQFNCGSIPANLHEIRSRLVQQRPDLILIQETNLQPGKVVKFEGYVAARVDRSTPRRSNKKLRGGGVMILVSTAYDNLSFEILPPIKPNNDDTTETVRIRLSCDRHGKIVSVDVLNIYIIPPIHKHDEDEREQHFGAANTFTPAFNEYERNNSQSQGLLIAGDVNAHAWEWDAISNEDDIGGDIMNFMDDYGFVVANDSLPTYHSSLHQHQTADGMEGETAPDVTFLHSESSLSNSNWRHQNPIGKQHHDVIYYEIDLRDCIDPLHPRRQRQLHKTSVSWSKVDWSEFNTSTNGSYDYYLRKHPCPPSKAKQVYYYDKALHYAFNDAAKGLPRGSGRPDPICWCTLEELLEARNEAWAMASSTKNEYDWEHFRETAVEFSAELKREKTRAWEEFASTLNYSTDPSKVMKILKAIQRDPDRSPTSFTMKSPWANQSLRIEAKQNSFGNTSRTS